jgi:uncharacterized protein YukE
MSDRADADPRDLRQFAKELRRFEDEIQAQTRRLKSSFDRVDWHDRERQRFEEGLSQMLKSIQRASESARPLSQAITKKAENLERYLGR